MEVMIALLIMGVVTTSIFKLYVTQHKNYIIQDDITSIQQNARASIDELARHIRMAGYNLPLGVAPIIAYNTDPDTLIVQYRTDSCQTSLTANMASSASLIHCDSGLSCFSDSQWVYIFEPDSGGGEWFEINHVDVAAQTISHTSSLSKPYTQDAVVISMEQVKFFLDTTTNPSTPCLMIQLPGQSPQVYAENISDLQFRYEMKNGMVIDTPSVVADVRAVNISVTGRSAMPDPDLADNESPTDEDSLYRQRDFSTTVYLRNVGI